VEINNLTTRRDKLLRQRAIEFVRAVQEVPRPPEDPGADRALALIKVPGTGGPLDGPGAFRESQESIQLRVQHRKSRGSRLSRSHEGEEARGW
jgi:hypothetical protein